jgi:hypothetical protein
MTVHIFQTAKNGGMKYYMNMLSNFISFIPDLEEVFHFQKRRKKTWRFTILPEDNGSKCVEMLKVWEA